MTGAPVTIYLPRDAAALSVGADEVADAVVAEAARRGLPLRLVRTGTRGALWLEPLLEIATPDGRIGYGPVAPSDVAAVLDAGMAGGGPHPLRLGRPEEIPFLARQQRLTFARCGIVDPLDLADYERHGGLAGLRAALALAPAEIVERVTASGLRGRGGAGFPAGIKWRTAAQAPGAPKYIVCNADEGDSGTFADRILMEGDPSLLIEGMVIAGLAVGAEEGFVYIRSEYPHAIATMRAAIAAWQAAGLLGADVDGSGRAFRLHLRRGAGAYICGEESAMIESIEGKRGLPRHRPPYVSVNGIFGRPTLVNNIETLYWVPEILKKGAAWFADQGKNDCKGLRSYSVSGRVKNPGVKLVPAGTTARELIEEHSGGMLDGHSFKGYLPGGPSGGILPAEMADIPLDFGQLEKHGSFVGSHAVVILSDKDDMKDVALNLLKFFEDESCGQCTPCRNGTEKAVKLMQQPNWDTDLLEELSAVMADASICGLGQAAPNPIRSVMKYFPGDLK